MITNKSELAYYLKEDLKAMGLSYRGVFSEFLRGNIYHLYLWRYVKRLRRLEYRYNQYMDSKSIWNTVAYLINKFRYQRLCQKVNMFVSPNVFGSGLHIVHPGYIWVDGSSRIGRNCTILPRVLLGKKRPGIPAPNIFIGDNCYIGTGATILGPVKIGNNVTIGAGALVIDDVPDNAIVGGVPARVIKIVS